MSKWAIRDIKHGKTFMFNSYDEMEEWILKKKEIDFVLKKDDMCEDGFQLPLKEIK